MKVVVKGGGLLVETAPLNRMNYAFFCRGCGEVWARIEDNQPGWLSVGTQCRNCWNRHWVSGSLFQGFHWAEQLPMMLHHPRLAEWEFNVHMVWAERGMRE